MGPLRSLTSLAVWAIVCIIGARNGVDSLVLPEGWTSHMDEKSGRQYYANRATGGTSWEPPPGSTLDKTPTDAEGTGVGGGAVATADSTSAQPAVDSTRPVGEVSEAADVVYASEGPDAGWALVDSFAALRKACAVNNARVIITADLVFDSHIVISGKTVTIKGAAGSSRLRTHESDATNFFKVTSAPLFSHRPPHLPLPAGLPTSLLSPTSPPLSSHLPPHLSLPTYPPTSLFPPTPPTFSSHLPPQLSQGHQQRPAHGLGPVLRGREVRSRRRDLRRVP